VCVLAPYGHQALNYANPYHQQAFNEHTPRFWTAAPVAGIDPAEYAHPQAGAWGLSESDLSAPGIDFRCLRMEFFYFQAYRGLPVAEQRAARKKYLDVCDQFMFHLLVVKPPLSEDDMQSIVENMEYYEPQHITARRASDRAELLEQSLAELRAKLQAAEAELAQARASSAALEGRLADEQAAAATRQAEAAQQAAARDRELAEARAALASLEPRARWLAAELEQTSERKVVRWLRRFARAEEQPQVLPAFQQLADDSRIFSDVRGYRLEPSRSLHAVDFVRYPLRGAPRPLKGLLLAPVLYLPAAEGRLGVELVSPDKNIVAQATLPMDRVSTDGPVRFDFAPVEMKPGERYWLRVFARDTTVPVRVLEWRRYGAGGLGLLQTRAFCGLMLE
jgi:hypothetical protein